MAIDSLGRGFVACARFLCRLLGFGAMTKTIPQRWFIGGLAIITLFAGVLFVDSGSNQPQYAGKRLSIWLDELSKIDRSRWSSDGAEHVKAVRTIGTNAVPWLLQELQEHRNALSGVRAWKWKLNGLLEKQTVLKVHLWDSYDRLHRVTVGFTVLGELAQPAVPELLASVNSSPQPVAIALAAIGFPTAVPALRSCLTNLSPFAINQSVLFPIPGETIGAIFNTTAFGSKDDVLETFPEIEAWARQSTNLHAKSRAEFFLKHY